MYTLLHDRINCRGKIRSCRSNYHHEDCFSYSRVFPCILWKRHCIAEFCEITVERKSRYLTDCIIHTIYFQDICVICGTANNGIEYPSWYKFEKPFSLYTIRLPQWNRLNRDSSWNEFAQGVSEVQNSFILSKVEYFAYRIFQSWYCNWCGLACRHYFLTYKAISF